MLFGEIPVFVIGAFAVAAYAPMVYTSDVQYLLLPEHYDDAQRSLRVAGWTRLWTLQRTNAGLGLYGSGWATAQGEQIDVLISDLAWAREAFFVPPSHTVYGVPVIPLVYLVLMKFDSPRLIDQADLARILGSQTVKQIDDVVRTVHRHCHDASAAVDLRRYHEIGKWEHEHHPFRHEAIVNPSAE